jgi:hypothetical protein
MVDVKGPSSALGAVVVLMAAQPAAAAAWNFQEIVLDADPPQPSRVTDCAIVDVDGDGRLDLWFSARGVPAVIR